MNYLIWPNPVPKFQFIGTLLVVTYDFLSMHMNITQSNNQFQYIGTPVINPDDHFVHVPSDMTQSNTQFQFIGYRYLIVVSHNLLSTQINVSQSNTQFKYIGTPSIYFDDHFVNEPSVMTQSNTQFQFIGTL